MCKMCEKTSFPKINENTRRRELAWFPLVFGEQESNYHNPFSSGFSRRCYFTIQTFTTVTKVSLTPRSFFTLPRKQFGISCKSVTQPGESRLSMRRSNEEYPNFRIFAMPIRCYLTKTTQPHEISVL